MTVSAKEIMKRVLRASFENGEISSEEFKSTAKELGLIVKTSNIYVPRIDSKTGKTIRSESIRVDIIGETVFLNVLFGSIKKVWRMPIASWNTLINPTEEEEN